MGKKGCKAKELVREEGAVNTARDLPASPYGSPPIYLPFSAVDAPLQQNPSAFATSTGLAWAWYPFAPITEAGWNQWLEPVIAPQPSPYCELINYRMPSHTQDIIIPFLVEKVSPVILLSGPMIVNVVDASPLTGLSFTVFNISTALIAIQLNALLPDPDTGPVAGGLSNYYFRAFAQVAG